MSIEQSVRAVRAPEGSGVRRVGIAMNGVTGRMGMNQHLIRSILAIREQGGVEVGREVIWPEPVLLGRDERKLARLAAAHGLERWSTDLDATLADPQIDVYFDAQLTQVRPDAIRKAIAAGKDVYCEKPVTETLEEGLELARLARQAGVRNGVVQDKLFLPGLLKLKELIDTGFFGRILSVRGEFGYWVFPGPIPKPQRPSWNYRKEDGGGILVDMFCHWRYVLDNLFGPVKSVSALGAIHIPTRVDEAGDPYEVTAEDAAYATFEIEDGPIVQMNSSWCVRVDRDELFELQVDGTDGSAVAGLRECRIQPAAATPMPVWNPDIPSPIDHRAAWQRVPDRGAPDNGFKIQWEQFLRHVTFGDPFPWDFLEAAKGIQLAELGMQSWEERRFVAVPELVL
jgi:predicted dehydrogenase